MPMKAEEKIYQIALGQVRGVGYVLSKKLMARFGSAQAIFQSTLRALTKAPGISKCIAQEIRSSDAFSKAAELLASHDKVNTRVITPWEAAYPERLKLIYGVPTLLYFRGNVDLTKRKSSVL